MSDTVAQPNLKTIFSNQKRALPFHIRASANPSAVSATTAAQFDDGKARAVEALLCPGAVVSVVARQHGATPQQLFTSRREARRRKRATAEGFVPVVVEAGFAGPRLPEPPSPPALTRPHSIELDVAGTSVFIWRGAGDGVRDHRCAEGYLFAEGRLSISMCVRDHS